MQLSLVSDKANRQSSELIGFAMRLYSIHPQRREWNVSRLGNQVMAAVYHEKIRVFYNRYGVPVGLVIWAFPSQSVQDVLLNEPNYVLHESEWDENGSLYIVDFIYLPGYLFSILNELRHTTFAPYKTVRFPYTNIKTNRRKLVSWNLRTYPKNSD